MAFEQKGVPKEFGICAKWEIVQRNLQEGKKDQTRLFLDRDGVINENSGYVNSWDRLVWNFRIFPWILKANQLNIPVSIISNQAGVAHGYYKEVDLVHFNLELLEKMEQMGLQISQFLYCPSHPEGIVAQYRKACECRKPGKRLFEWSFVSVGGMPRKSLFIGDSYSDRQAAKSLDIKFKYESDDTFSPEKLGELLGNGLI